MPYYRVVTDEDGNESYEEVDFSSLDLSEVPDDRFYEDPRYKDVADRDFKRRQALKEREEELARLQQGREGEAEPEETSVDTISQAELQQLLEEREERLLQRALEAVNNTQRQAQERANQLTQLLSDNNLPDDFREVLEASSEPEKVAKALSRHSKSFGNVKPSNASPEDEIANTLTAVNKRLGLDL